MTQSLLGCAALWALVATPAAGQQSEPLEERVARLEEENRRLAEALQEARRPRPANAAHLVAGELKVRLTGYVDAGFFKAGGDGVAYALDAGKRNHPEYSDIPWVFDGDPWANPVNSQGDSADLGLDRTNIARFDPIRSQGRPSFILNMVNLGLVGSHGGEFLVEASLNIEPRQGLLGSTGDFVDVDLAYVEWIASRKHDLHFFAGKFESIFGIEYRGRKAPDRYGVTPSIISRYTSGTPTGVKARFSPWTGPVTLNLALTNGGMFTERFAHFFNEIDKNAFKTATGRLSYTLPLPFFLEVGASGQYGAQDGQPDENVPQWMFGFDAKLAVGDVIVRGEYLRTRAQGGGLSEAPVLRAEGFYVDASYQFLPWFGVLARVDHRNAFLLAETNLYLTNVSRVTAGLRFDINFHLIAKVEYLRVQEMSGPELDDDVFTSSLILRF
ncbi:MAG: outer membrane beta-barrel protein [Myxococcota bacterium]